MDTLLSTLVGVKADPLGAALRVKELPTQARAGGGAHSFPSPFLGLFSVWLTLH